MFRKTCSGELFLFWVDFSGWIFLTGIFDSCLQIFGDVLGELQREELEEKEKIHWRNSKNPMETVPRNKEERTRTSTGSPPKFFMWEKSPARICQDTNRRRTNVQQLTCKIDLPFSFYFLFFSCVLLELKPFVLKGKVLGEKL